MRRTYGDVAGDLARSLAHLLATSEPADHPDAVLAARAAVADGVRGAVDALTSARYSPPRPEVADLELHPARALRAALHHLPRPRPSVALSDAVADGRLPRAWAAAAGAALELSGYDEVLRRLDVEPSWTALGDMASIASALTAIDESLRTDMPGAGLPGRRASATVRIAAAAVEREARLHPQSPRLDAMLEPVPPAPITIRRAADVPVALDRIVAMIRARGPLITMHDFGGVLEPLARSLDDASRILHVTAWRLKDPEPLLAMAMHAERTRDALKEVVRHRGRVMTIGPPDCALIGQAVELRGAMRSLLNFVGTTDGAKNLGPGRVSHELISRSWRITRELRRSVEMAGDAGQLLVMRHRSSSQDRTWAAGPPLEPRVHDLLESLGLAADLGVLPNAIRRVGARALGPRFEVNHHQREHHDWRQVLDQQRGTRGHIPT